VSQAAMSVAKMMQEYETGFIARISGSPASPAFDIRGATWYTHTTI
jgi:hypothetical protein